MKASKIIFLSLLGVTAAFILAGAIDIRINGRGPANGSFEVENTTFTIPAFKYLDIVNIRNVQIVRSDSAYIEVTRTLKSAENVFSHSEAGDTLRLTGSGEADNGLLFVKLMVSSPIRLITSRNSGVSIKGYSSPALSFDLYDSRVRLEKTWTGEHPLTFLSINANANSHFYTDEFSADSVKITLDNSAADLQLRTQKLTGKLQNGSTLTSRQAGSISVSRDQSSKLRMRD